VALVAVGLWPATAGASQFGIKSFEAGTCNQRSCTYSSVKTEPTQAYNQAGGHPGFGITGFEVNAETVNPLLATLEKPIGHLKRARVDVPPGLAANPQAIRSRKPRHF